MPTPHATARKHRPAEYVPGTMPCLPRPANLASPTARGPRRGTAKDTRSGSRQETPRTERGTYGGTFGGRQRGLRHDAVEFVRDERAALEPEG